MTDEQKDLLFKDLSARLPYDVFVNIRDIKCVLQPHDISDLIKCDVDIKPYLIPLSSITEEQYDELEKATLNDYMDHMRITNELREKVEFITHWPLYSPDIIDWFNRNHFDYRGLIEMGLALKAPDGMYN